MTRLGLLLVLIAVVATCPPLAAQQPTLAFEVVSVKPHTSDDGRLMMVERPTPN